MGKILYICVDSSPLPDATEEVVCLDCNLEYGFYSFFGKTLMEKAGNVEGIKYPGELLSDFAKFNKNDYRMIINQWERIIPFLLNKIYGDFDGLSIKLPPSFCNWLCQQEISDFQEIGRNLKTCPSVVCNVESLYEEVIVKFLMKKITYYLKKNGEEIESVTLPFPLYSDNCIEDICQQFETPIIEIRNGWHENAFDGLGFADYDFHDGFALYESGGWYAFMNKHGNLCQQSLSEYFFNAHDYSEGLAAVQSIQDGNQWGFIDGKGEFIIPCNYEEVGDFANGLARVKSNGKWGFIDRQGKEKIECKYDFATDFSGYPMPLKLALVGKGSDLYYIDDADNVCLLCDSYDSYFSFHEGLAGVKLNGSYGFINWQAEEHIPCKYEDISYFSERLACVKYMNKWGYIDTGGRAVRPCIYDEAYPMSDGLALVRSQNKYGYINRKGEIIVPFIYDKADLFDKEFVARVMCNGNKSYIDIRGNVLFNHFYDSIDNFCNVVAVVRKDRKIGLNNRQGKEIWPCGYYCDGSVNRIYLEDFLIVSRGKKYGILNLEGEELIPCILDDVSPFSGEGENHKRYGVIKRNNKYGLIEISKDRKYINII